MKNQKTEQMTFFISQQNDQFHSGQNGLFHFLYTFILYRTLKNKISRKKNVCSCNG